MRAIGSVFLVFQLNLFTISAFDLTTTTDCRKTVNCFRVPNDCKSTEDCQVLVKYKEDGVDMIDITIHGKHDGWIAFGLTEETRQMGGAHGEVCMKVNSVTSLKGFVTEGTHFNAKDLDSKTVPINRTYNNGRLTCRYKRKYTGSYMRNADEEFHLIVSWGPVEIKRNNEGEAQERDVGAYYWSEDKVKLTAGLQSHESESFGWKMIALHGSLMLFGWLLFGANGIIHAAYTKIAYGDSKLCGVMVWFQAHLANMMLCFLFTVAGFIVIFVESKKISKDFLLHAIVGIIAMALATINVMGGFFRPDKDSRLRPAFKWGIRLSGYLTQILAVICMITGLLWVHVLAVPVYVALGFTCIGAVILEITKCITKRSKEAGHSTFTNEMTASTAEISTAKKDSPAENETMVKVTNIVTPLMFLINILATIVAVVLLVVKANDLTL